MVKIKAKTVRLHRAVCTKLKRNVKCYGLVPYEDGPYFKWANAYMLVSEKEYQYIKNLKIPPLTMFNMTTKAPNPYLGIELFYEREFLDLDLFKLVESKNGRS